MTTGTSQGVLYDPRFLARHTGSIMHEPMVALMELVANAWDAYATKVEIQWPNVERGIPFAITDNGHGMTEDEFNARWRVLNYDRIQAQGDKVEPPADVLNARVRLVYGRNGMGRHAMFCFDQSAYFIRTWKNGVELTVRVSRPASLTAPFQCEVTGRKKAKKGAHGTEIRAANVCPIALTPDDARDAIGTRFLADPTFEVFLNAKQVSFAQISDPHLRAFTLAIPGLSPPIEVTVIDPGASNKTTRQKGLAWWVGKRLVGDCTWENLDGRKLLDGRSHDAKRYTIVIQADALREAVHPDWSGFDHKAALWKANSEEIGRQIGGILDDLFRDKREQRRQAILATAKVVLSTVRERLSTLDELRRKMYVVTTDEVHELQPLFERGLWMFGAEFESIEFRANQSMTSVIKGLFKVDEDGSRKRPDFVVLPDSSVGFYSRPGYDNEGRDTPAERVVIVELKRPGIAIGRKECDQVREYYVELEQKGCLNDVRRVDAYVLGSELHPSYGRSQKFGSDPVMNIEPLRYDRLVDAASKRMMRLDREVRTAPFLNPQEIERFLEVDTDDPQLPILPVTV